MSTEKHPVIFLVEEDDDTRPLLKRNLQSYGYDVTIALDEADAIERIGDLHVPADLMLINQIDISTDEMIESARRIRRHSQFKRPLPIIVLAEKYGEEMEGKDVCVGENEYVTYTGEEPEQLRELLAHVLNGKE